MFCVIGTILLKLHFFVRYVDRHEKSTYSMLLYRSFLNIFLVYGKKVKYNYR